MVDFKLGNIGQGLKFLKDYSSLVVPIILVIVAVLIFVPTQLVSGKLKKEMSNESLKRGKRIESARSSAVSKQQPSVEQQYQQSFADDANQIEQTARQSSRRALLSYQIFPEPKDKSALIFEEYSRQFRDALDRLIDRVNAMDCPTEEELSATVQGSNRQTKGRGTGATNDRQALIRDGLCRARAETAWVYANPADLGGYEFWEEYKFYDVGLKDATDDCWYWQVGYWIIEDIIDTIAKLNYGSRSVFTSPVKRLVGISFVAGGSQGTKTDGDRPGYVVSGQEAVATPWTTRVCNDDIDVVHLSVTVVVSAKDILSFMTELCNAKEHIFKGFSGQQQQRTYKHNQITILESNFGAVEPYATEHELYRYGEDAVVELELICEYIFNRRGYDEIKPASVMESLGQQPLEKTAANSKAGTGGRPDPF